MTELNFAIDKEDIQDAFQPLPAGDYEGVILDAKVDENLEKETTAIIVKLEVVGGEHEGRIQMVYLAIKSKSDIAVKIAKTQLTRLCIACGLDGVLNNTDQLIDKLIRFEVSLKAKKNGDGFYANVKFLLSEDSVSSESSTDADVPF